MLGPTVTRALSCICWADTRAPAMTRYASTTMILWALSPAFISEFQLHAQLQRTRPANLIERTESASKRATLQSASEHAGGDSEALLRSKRAVRPYCPKPVGFRRKIGVIEDVESVKLEVQSDSFPEGELAAYPNIRLKQRETPKEVPGEGTLTLS